MLGRCFAGSGLLTVVLLFGFCICSMCSGWTLINGAASLYLCILLYVSDHISHLRWPVAA